MPADKNLYLRSLTDKGDTANNLLLRSEADKVPAAGTTVTPDTLALTLVAYTSVLKEVVTPSTLALTWAGYTSVLGEVVTPGTLALVLGTYSPVLKEVLTPSTLALVLATYVSDIIAGNDIVVTPGTLALVLGGYAPSLLGTLTVYVYVTSPPDYERFIRIVNAKPERREWLNKQLTKRGRQ